MNKNCSVARERDKAMRKVIISLAPVKAGTPVHAWKLADDVEKSVAKGAAMCHLHCRNIVGGLTKNWLYLETCFEEIRKRVDVVVQASTGGVSNLTIEERCTPLEYQKVESSSLNGGTTNLGEAVYVNSFEDIRYCANKSYEAGIIPEVEVFDIGMIHAVENIVNDVPFRKPILYNLVFGHSGGMQPTIESLVAFKSFVPDTALWGVTHYERDNWHFLAAAIAMGASVVRIGFEDSSFLSEGEEATYNFELVERLTTLIHGIGFEVATPEEARKIMGIQKK